jgi:hypothetical protein
MKSTEDKSFEMDVLRFFGFESKVVKSFKLEMSVERESIITVEMYVEPLQDNGDWSVITQKFEVHLGEIKPKPKPKSEAKELKAFCKSVNKEFGSVVNLHCSSLSVLQDLLENDVKKKAEAVPKLVKRIEDFLDKMQPIISWGANS